MKLTYPERINREILKHQPANGEFRPVAVDVLTGMICVLEWTIPIQVDGQLYRHQFDTDAKGAEWENFYRITRVGQVNFLVERLRWRLDHRAIADAKDEHEIRTTNETIEFKSGTWTASEFSRWYATGTNTVKPLSHQEYHAIINLFLTQVLDGTNAIKLATKQFQ